MVVIGVLLIVLGLLSAGVVADFLVENDLTTAAAQPFTLFGTTFSLSEPSQVLAAFCIGVLSVVLLILGVRLLRGSRGRRRTLKHRIADLEAENARLLSREHLESLVKVPEAIPEPEQAAVVPDTDNQEDQPQDTWA